MKELTLELICELDEVELGQRAQSLSLTTLKIDEVEDNKAEANKAFKEELNGLREQARKLSHTLRTKTELRPVVCIVDFHSPTQATKRITRKDTGEFYRDEPMTGFECQTHLFEPDVNLEELAERVEASGATEVVATLLDHMKSSAEMDDALDQMAAPIREGEVTSLTISSEGQSVTIDKAAAERIHKRVSKNKEAGKPQFRQEPENR